MTLNVETPRVVYTGSGTRGPFALSVGGTPITYSASSHIIAERYSEDGVLLETLVEGVDYDLSATSIATGDSAATLTIDASADVLAADEKLVIRRSTTLSQTLALVQGGGFSSSANEANYDKVFRILQELSAELGRQITINPVSSGVSTDLPVPAAGYVLGWNADEDALENLSAIPTDTVAVSPAWAAVIEKASIALGLTEAGFSAFVQTLLNDADASTFLSTLGISTFAKTILDDADAAAVRTTIGAQALDATLSALAALSTSASQYIRATGVDTFTMDSYATLASNIQNSFVSGTYTPTLTNSTNVAASTAAVCSYIRIGNTVFVSGSVNIDVTSAATLTLLGMSLPIASNFAAVSDLGGVAANGNGAAISAYSIFADATNDRASIQGYSSSVTTDVFFSFSFMYRVI